MSRMIGLLAVLLLVVPASFAAAQAERPHVLAAVTVDDDGDGLADAVRLTVNKRLDDASGFDGVELAGAGRAGTGPEPGDARFDARLAPQLPGDSRPAVRIVRNTSLADIEGQRVAAMDAPIEAADGVAPRAAGAWATSRRDVRARFTEPLDRATVAAAGWQLSMAGRERTVLRARVAADGRTVDLRAARRWAHAAAGTLRLADTLADAAGNLRAGAGELRVWAAPGDTTAPRLVGVGVRLLGRRRGLATFRLDEASTIDLAVRRLGSSAASRESYDRPRGRGTIDFGPTVEGRRLRAGTYDITLTAVDPAGNESRAVTRRLTIPT